MKLLVDGRGRPTHGPPSSFMSRSSRGPTRADAFVESDACVVTGKVLRQRWSHIRVCAAAIRTPLEGLRKPQRSGLGVSSRSPKIHSVTAAIAATCPRETRKGSSISAQHEPAHHTPCVIPKRSASTFAAGPNAASSGCECPRLRQACFAGENCHTIAATITKAAINGSAATKRTSRATVRKMTPAAIQIAAYPATNSTMARARRRRSCDCERGVRAQSAAGPSWRSTLVPSPLLAKHEG